MSTPEPPSPARRGAQEGMNPLFCAIGSKDTALSDTELNQHVTAFLDALGPKEQVMIVPPDFTRYHSQAGKITQIVTEHYGYPSSATAPKIDILPALGTHAPMTEPQIRTMFGDKLADAHADSTEGLIHVHDWRNDVETIGYVPAELVSAATHGKIQDQAWPAQLNRRVWELRKQDKRKTVVLSIGQVVPHEVMGMANFNKNLFVGVGGVEAINLSHFIGAIHGMERMMGRAHNPLRDILNYASDKFLQGELNLWYILTVMGRNATTGNLEMKGLYIGNDIQCYDAACQLSMQVNFTLLSKPPSTMVAYMDPDEFQSTWLGNKSIYRTRMAIADGGTLIVLAPGVHRCGEDDKVDELIRKYGYVGTPRILKYLEDNPELQDNLSAVAHLVHGSSEGRFRVIYCPALSQKEVEQVGFEYGDLKEMMKKYDVEKLQDGWNIDLTTGEEFYYISNPALGLWAVPERFEESSSEEEVPATVTTTTSLQSQAAVDGSGGVGGWAKPPVT
jgi:nickel-dependent lactate racemase